MRVNFISCPDNVVLDAVTAVMACVPKPWTTRMVEDAIDAVLSVADQWRSSEAREVDADDLHTTYLEERLGLDGNDALLREIVAE